MTWNYRIIDHDDHLALHEVHYDANGAVTSWTEKPVTFVCDPEEGARGIVGSLELALSDATKRSVLALAALRAMENNDAG